jgi:hypothetical protein
MDTNTTDDWRRAVDPVPRVLRIIAGIALGRGLGFVVSGYVGLTMIAVSFQQYGRTHSPRPLTGGQDAAVSLLIDGSFHLALLLWPLLPVALALGAACIGSDPVAKRGLRTVALVVGASPASCSCWTWSWSPSNSTRFATEPRSHCRISDIVRPDLRRSRSIPDTAAPPQGAWHDGQIATGLSCRATC